ncbi:MAG: tetratricopeptide repeat protein [Marinobacterium sp.]|nr:tetratricopeptide repeat protein [Marinobacterium sp.]
MNILSVLPAALRRTDCGHYRYAGRALAATLLGASLLLGSGCGSSTEKRLPQAEQTSEQALDERYRLAQIAASNGQHAAAIKLYRELLAALPGQAPLHCELADAASADQQFELALHHYQKALELAPTMAEAWRGIGRTRLAEQQLAQAREALEQAWQLNSEDPLTLNSLGVTADLQNRHRQAQQYYREAMALQPGNQEFRNNLALSHLLAGQPQQTVDLLYPLVRSGRASAKVRNNLAVALGLLGADGQARAVMTAQEPEQQQQNLAYFHWLRTQGQHSGTEYQRLNSGQQSGVDQNSAEANARTSAVVVQP